MKKSMNLREMKKALRVKTHIRAGGVVIIKGQGEMHQNHKGG